MKDSSASLKPGRAERGLFCLGVLQRGLLGRGLAQRGRGLGRRGEGEAEDDDGRQVSPSAALTNSQSDTADIVKQALGFSPAAAVTHAPLHTRRPRPPFPPKPLLASERQPARGSERQPSVWVDEALCVK